MIYGKGINDMENGWRLESKWNKRVYQVWADMIRRCYSEKWQEKYPTYIGCTVCKKWHKLSGFIEDIKLIEGYDEENFLNGKLCLDKDIKSNGMNKKYIMNNCMWVSKSENTKQSNKTMDYNFLQGENHPMYGVHRYGKNAPNTKRVAQYDLNMNLIKIWDYAKQASEEIPEINYGGLRKVLQGRTKTHQYKGYIWKYITTTEED